MQIKSDMPESAANGQIAAAVPGNGALAGASREFHNLLTDIEDLIKSATSLTGEDLARARAKLTAKVHAAKESVELLGGAVATRARDTAKATDTYVHEQPWQAIGIGAAIGLLVGILLARR